MPKWNWLISWLVSLLDSWNSHSSTVQYSTVQYDAPPGLTWPFPRFGVYLGGKLADDARVVTRRSSILRHVDNNINLNDTWCRWIDSEGLAVANEITDVSVYQHMGNITRLTIGTPAMCVMCTHGWWNKRSQWRWWGVLSDGGLPLLKYCALRDRNTWPNNNVGRSLSQCLTA